MLISIFKSNKPIVNALTIFLLTMLWLPAFFSENDSAIFILTKYKWLDVLISILLIATQSLYLNFVITKYNLLSSNSHLTSLFFILFNSCIIEFYALNKIIFANTFILIAFHQVLRIYNSKNNYSISFNAGIFIGIAGLIYFPSFIYFTLLFIALIYTSTPSWREFIITIIGLLIPVCYFITYHFVVGSLSTINITDYLIPTFLCKWNELSISKELLFVIITTIIVLSLLALFVKIGKSVVRASKMLVLVLLMFLLGLGTIFLNQFDFLATFLVLIIPISIIVAILFQNIKKRWLAELLFTCLFASIVIGYFS